MIESKNDVNPPKSLKQFQNSNIDFDSPRMKKALDNLGITHSELQIK